MANEKTISLYYSGAKYSIGSACRSAEVCPPILTGKEYSSAPPPKPAMTSRGMAINKTITLYNTGKNYSIDGRWF